MNELVMVVDDEPGILTAMEGILKDEGYRVLVTPSGTEALALYRQHRPDVVFLDIWLADRDGLETLQDLREADPTAAVIMISGHGTTATAVKSIKMGAFDYLEKPLSYDAVTGAVRGALSQRRAPGEAPVLELAKARTEERRFARPPLLSMVREGAEPQRTVRSASVIYGLGLHSGGRTGMVLQPLPPNSGIHFLTLPRGTLIPAHVAWTADTEYATTLAREGETIRTIEHLLSALHAAGICNLLVKVHGEIPVLDGSALEFCRRLEEIGIEDQGVARKELVVDRRFSVEEEGGASLVLEPADQLEISYLLRYPQPIGEQAYRYRHEGFDSFKREVAPARTFGFMRDLKMINELGLGSGGRLDNFILVGEDEVINTELRFPDEFVRHKILDIVGDLYLLGYPVRGRITARLSGHRHNIALQRKILAEAS